jgi:rhamnose transport system substrate-binding protein
VAKAIQDEGLYDEVKVSGPGRAAEMLACTLNGCAPEFALWSFVGSCSLTCCVTCLLPTGAPEGGVGESFEAGRTGDYTVGKDPTRDAGLRVVMDPVTICSKDNVGAAAQWQACRPVSAPSKAALGTKDEV